MKRKMILAGFFLVVSIAAYNAWAKATIITNSRRIAIAVDGSTDSTLGGVSFGIGSIEDVESLVGVIIVGRAITDSLGDIDSTGTSVVLRTQMDGRASRMIDSMRQTNCPCTLFVANAGQVSGTDTLLFRNLELDIQIIDSTGDNAASSGDSIRMTVWWNLLGRE